MNAEETDEPKPTEPEPLCLWEPDLTREEIQKRIDEPGGMTLAEFRRLGFQPRSGDRW